jgi:hypothetical protein
MWGIIVNRKYERGFMGFVFKTKKDAEKYKVWLIKEHGYTEDQLGIMQFEKVKEVNKLIKSMKRTEEKYYA